MDAQLNCHISHSVTVLIRLEVTDFHNENKTGRILITQHWGAFALLLLPLEGNIY